MFLILSMDFVDFVDYCYFWKNYLLEHWLFESILDDSFSSIRSMNYFIIFEKKRRLHFIFIYAFWKTYFQFTVYWEHEFFFSSVFIFGNAYLLPARMLIPSMKEIYKNISHPLIEINSIEKRVSIKSSLVTSSNMLKALIFCDLILNFHLFNL